MNKRILDLCAGVTTVLTAIAGMSYNKDLLQLLPSAWTPYITYADDLPLNQWAELNNSPNWSAFHLIKLGQRVEENAVSIADSRTEPGNCKPNFETTWDAPRIVSHGKKKSKKQKSNGGEATEPSPEMPAAAMTLEVSGPQFGQASNRGSCSQPSMLGCTKKFTIVAVDSVPPGAEIWVDNESTAVTTRGTLSVPYCPGREKTKQILVRMPGRVTCPRDVPMAEGIRAEVMCELALPK